MACLLWLWAFIFSHGNGRTQRKCWHINQIVDHLAKMLRHRIWANFLVLAPLFFPSSSRFHSNLCVFFSRRIKTISIFQHNVFIWKFSHIQMEFALIRCDFKLWTMSAATINRIFLYISPLADGVTKLYNG